MPKKTFRQKVLHVLAGVGISATSLLLVLGLFLAFVTVAKLLRAFIDHQLDAVILAARESAPSAPARKSEYENKNENELLSSSSLSSSPAQEGLVFASYTDLFSSNAGIDGAATTMHRDDIVTAFLLPPNVEWLASSESPSSPVESNCLPSGEACISIKGAVLTLNGTLVTLPVGEGEIENIAAEIIGDRWVVGLSRKVAHANYRGYVYWVSGNGTFTPVFDSPIRSEFSGTWGFGGTPDDLLAVYGAYQGKVYRIRTSSSVIGHSSLVDVSWLFDVRAMKGGITPGIIRIPSSVIGHQSSVSWYVFNKARNNHPLLLKLFQNGTNEIVGAIDLLSTAPQAFSYLILNSQFTIPNSLNAYTERNGIAAAWSIADKGFSRPSKPLVITSVNLNNYVNAEVPHVMKLGFREFSLGGAKISLEVSNGGEWESIGVLPSSITIKDYWFKNPKGTALKWKAIITPGTNPEHTPFIGVLDLDYEVKRP
ncbi:MAG: hypothetical protein FJY98_04810 [Candidatus Liptonbacteria bacterium]|nr:hypothetical protein [Candidatus Liptonbacteria bacterium]